MIAGFLHALGIIELLERIAKFLPKERADELIVGGKDFYKSLEARFAAAAREKFWPWAQTAFMDRDPVGWDLLFARQQARHEWWASGGAFNEFSETYMNTAFGRVFTETTDPEDRFRIFGQVARMNDAQLAAWLDAVTDDGFEQYFAYVRRLAAELWAGELQHLHAQAANGLRWAAVGAAIFFVVFAFAEVSGWDLIHGFLAIYLMVGAVAAFWRWPTVVAGLSAFKPTRPAMEVVGAAFAAASLLLVLGILVPLHLAPWQAQMMALIALLGLSSVAYWGFLKGMHAPMFSPKTVGATLALVLVLVTLWALNEKYPAIGQALTSVQNQVKGIEFGSASKAEAAEVRVSGCDIGATEGMRHTFVAGNNFSNLEKIPPHSEFRITADAPVEVLFTDGASYVLSGDGCEDMGHHSLAHFRVRSVSGEPAHVSVATRGIK